MKNLVVRRNFIKSFLSLPLFTVTGALLANSEATAAQARNVNGGKSKLKMSLNAFSFNAPLAEKKMTLDELLETCAEIGFEGVNITAYYFPGYPNVPSDEYLYRIKRKAFRLGLDIQWTGVRNDFRIPIRIKGKNMSRLLKIGLMLLQNLERR